MWFLISGITIVCFVIISIFIAEGFIARKEIGRFRIFMVQNDYCKIAEYISLRPEDEYGDPRRGFEKIVLENGQSFDFKTMSGFEKSMAWASTRRDVR